MNPECTDPDSSDRSLSGDILLRDEPDEKKTKRNATAARKMTMGTEVIRSDPK
jgi:hypothetical protein